MKTSFHSSQPRTIHFFALFILSLTFNLHFYSAASGQTESGQQIEHVTVFYEEGMFGGWPANYGIWNWDNEILVGFAKGYHKDLGSDLHNIDRDRTELHLLARSTDGGESWSIEDPAKESGAFLPGAYHGVARTDVQPPPMKECNEGMHFEHPDFALTARMNDKDAGQSHFWYSYDRGKDWEGPCRISNFGIPGTSARTDYIIDSDQEALLFLTAAKPDGNEGRPFVIRTADGGEEWDFLSWIGPEPDGFSIMPASARLSDQEILVTVRRREGPDRFIAAYLSSDNGNSWKHLDNPVDDVGIGNPPAMVRMQDGRIALAYGYRSDEGSSMNLKFSSDKGRSWSDAVVLREDGADRDAGYPRMIQRPNGKLVIFYYWNHGLSEGEPPYRYIAATFFDPGQ